MMEIHCLYLRRGSDENSRKITSDRLQAKPSITSDAPAKTTDKAFRWIVETPVDTGEKHHSGITTPRIVSTMCTIPGIRRVLVLFAYSTNQVWFSVVRAHDSHVWAIFFKSESFLSPGRKAHGGYLGPHTYNECLNMCAFMAIARSPFD